MSKVQFLFKSVLVPIGLPQPIAQARAQTPSQYFPLEKLFSESKPDVVLSWIAPLVSRETELRAVKRLEGFTVRLVAHLLDPSGFAETFVSTFYPTRRRFPLRVRLVL